MGFVCGITPKGAVPRRGTTQEMNPWEYRPDRRATRQARAGNLPQSPLEAATAGAPSIETHKTGPGIGEQAVLPRASTFAFVLLLPFPICRSFFFWDRCTPETEKHGPELSTLDAATRPRGEMAGPSGRRGGGRRGSWETLRQLQPTSRGADRTLAESHGQARKSPWPLCTIHSSTRSRTFKLSPWSSPLLPHPLLGVICLACSVGLGWKPLPVPANGLSHRIVFFPRRRLARWECPTTLHLPPPVL